MLVKEVDTSQIITILLSYTQRITKELAGIRKLSMVLFLFLFIKDDEQLERWNEFFSSILALCE